MASGYTRPDPPIEVGVTKYELCSDSVAATAIGVETDSQRHELFAFVSFAAKLPLVSEGIIRLPERIRR